MSGFSIRFLGCKLAARRKMLQQRLDVPRVERRREIRHRARQDRQTDKRHVLADGHLEGGTDVAVVNTCCVTHEAVRKSRQAASRAAGTHRRVYVTGCAANLAPNVSNRL